MSASKKKMYRREAAAAQGMTEKEKQEQKKAQAAKRTKIIAIVGGIVAVIAVIALLVWYSGLIPRTVTALNVNGTKYSVTDMEYYYHQAANSEYYNQQNMASLYSQLGMEVPDGVVTFDPQKPYDEQYQSEGVTYRDYFLQQAKASVEEITALVDAAHKAGYTLSEDGQSSLNSQLESLDQAVTTYNYGSRATYLKYNYGRSMTEKVFLKNLERVILASDYSTSVTSQMKDYSDDELEAYYQDNKDTLDSFTYDSAYFDGTAPSTEDSDGNKVDPTDEEKAAAMSGAKTKADAFLAAVKSPSDEDKEAAKKDGESVFLHLAPGHTSNYWANDRVYAGGSQLSSMPFAEWIKSTDRKDGDVDVFELSGSGYYVVEFHSRERDDRPTADVRHILISTATDSKDEEGKKYVESTAKAKAQHVLDQFLGGDQTPELFGELAEKYSEDTRDDEGNLRSAGGLYSGVKADGTYMAEFTNWAVDPSHKVGDTGIVQTSYGFHVMYLQAMNDPQWKSTAQSAKSSSDQTAWMESIKEGYTAVETGSYQSVGK